MSGEYPPQIPSQEASTLDVRVQLQSSCSMLQDLNINNKDV